jgi:hypothetical protein
VSLTVLAAKAWPLVKSDLQWFINHGHGKKMYMDEVSIRLITSFRGLNLAIL